MLQELTVWCEVDLKAFQLLHSPRVCLVRKAPLATGTLTSKLKQTSGDMKHLRIASLFISYLVLIITVTNLTTTLCQTTTVAMATEVACFAVSV